MWGWSNAATWACIVVGALIIAFFVLLELRTDSPLIAVGIFRIRPFAVENVVLLIAMMAFVPMFFFASEYAQISLHKKASETGIILLFFFIGFVVAAQVGGRILDREGAKRAVVMGAAIAAVGFGLWASKVTTLSFPKQQWFVVIAGAGMGMLLGPANTDAVNRASSLSYGEATGITQTIRNFGASLGLAALGTVQLFNFRSQLDLLAAGTAGPQRGCGSPPADPGQPGHRRLRGIHSPLRVAGLRPRHRDRALCDVRDHGLRRRGRPIRPQTGSSGRPAVPEKRQNRGRRPADRAASRTAGVPPPLAGRHTRRVCGLDGGTPNHQTISPRLLPRRDQMPPSIDP